MNTYLRLYMVCDMMRDTLKRSEPTMTTDDIREIIELGFRARLLKDGHRDLAILDWDELGDTLSLRCMNP